MARSKQPLPTTVTTASGVAAALTGDIAQLVEDLDAILTRVRLGAIREQLDGLLEEAAWRQLNLREALAWLRAAGVAAADRPVVKSRMLQIHVESYREGEQRHTEPGVAAQEIGFQ